MSEFLSEFARITLGVVQADRAGPYLPTAADFRAREISALEGVPDDVSSEAALLDWLDKRGLRRDGVCFGVKTQAGELILGEFTKGSVSFVELDVATGETAAVAQPDWWR
jgi:hypothetical protein